MLKFGEDLIDSSIEEYGGSKQHRKKRRKGGKFPLFIIHFVETMDNLLRKPCMHILSNLCRLPWCKLLGVASISNISLVHGMY